MTTLRARKSAAPLKLGKGGFIKQGEGNTPCSKERGSVEAALKCQSRRRSRCTPCSKERGSVEAAMSAQLFADEKDTPCSKERGSVEAYARERKVQ